MAKTSLVTLIAICCALGCERAEPPSRAEPQRPVARAAPSARPSPRPAPAPSSSPAPSLAPAPSASALPVAKRDELVPPPLVGPDGGVLGQTEDDPSLDSPWFEGGTKALFRAIVEDDPSLAKDFFFPLEAYRQVKDVADPERDWRRRLMAHFERDVHRHHRRLGASPEKARFVSLDVDKSRIRWMKPRSEGNKLPYFRVTHSKLRYEDAEGKRRELEVTSFISWRGEWYLVHLDGFE